MLKLSPTEKQVLCVSAEMEDRGENPNIDTIAESTGLTLGQVEHAVAVLVNVGLAEGAP